ALVKPHYFMPFHGDFRMLKKHGHLAQELGIPKENNFVCANGEALLSLCSVHIYFWPAPAVLFHHPSV
ncbi:7717_t:CDS:2, partial [Gigaspora rosea]